MTALLALVLTTAMVDGAVPGQQARWAAGLDQLGSYGGADTLARGEYVFELIGSGFVRESRVFVLDLGSSKVVALDVAADGAFGAAVTAGGQGTRVLGRLWQPCCVAAGPGGTVAVGEPRGVVTLFDHRLVPVGRNFLGALSGLAALSWMSPPRWLLLTTDSLGEHVHSVEPGAETMVGTPGYQPLWQSHDSVGHRLSPGRMLVMGDSSLLVSSSATARLTKLRLDGTFSWRRDLGIPPDLPDPVFDGASDRIREAGFRASSMVMLPDGDILVSVFRPGRPQTVLHVVSPGGELRAVATIPVPVWFFGVAHGTVLVGARVSDRHELVSFRVPRP